MHVSLPISSKTTLMGADNTALFNQPVSTSNFSLSINTDNKDEADTLFQSLSEDGEIKLPMNETFWGSYYGIVTDKFGINWKISFESEFGTCENGSRRQPETTEQNKTIADVFFHGTAFYFFTNELFLSS